MPDSPLTLSLSAPAQSRLGEPVPVSVRVRNSGSTGVWMVGVLDGSELGVRFPKYLPEVTGPAGEETTEMESDMVAPLRAQDFRRLEPGEEFDPTTAEGGRAYLPLYTFVNFRPAGPGTYRFRLTLVTESESDEQWLGSWGDRGDPEVKERLAQVPRVTVVVEADVTITPG